MSVGSRPSSQMLARARAGAEETCARLAPRTPRRQERPRCAAPPPPPARSAKFVAPFPLSARHPFHPLLSPRGEASTRFLPLEGRAARSRPANGERPRAQGAAWEQNPSSQAGSQGRAGWRGCRRGWPPASPLGQLCSPSPVTGPRAMAPSPAVNPARPKPPLSPHFSPKPGAAGCRPRLSPAPGDSRSAPAFSFDVGKNRARRSRLPTAAARLVNQPHRSLTGRALPGSAGEGALTCHSFGSARELGPGRCRAVRQHFVGLLIIFWALLLPGGRGASGGPGLRRGGRWRRARGLARLCKRNGVGAERLGVPPGCTPLAITPAVPDHAKGCVFGT